MSNHKWTYTIKEFEPGAHKPCVKYESAFYTFGSLASGLSCFISHKIPDSCAKNNYKEPLEWRQFYPGKFTSSNFLLAYDANGREYQVVFTRIY